MKKNKTIDEYLSELTCNSTSYNSMYEDAISRINQLKNFNCSLRTYPFKHFENKKSRLNGIVYSLKDNIATAGVITTGGSLFLSDYVPSYDAYVKKLLDEAGAICVSKDNLDEFGLGGTGTHSAYGIVKNPYDEKRIAGGSSSGCSVMVSKNVVPFAIATDTGDSIRKPASFQGIVGFKPTYGAISRWGVYPYSPSLDHVGILANCVSDVATVFSCLAKKDVNDMTSIDISDEYFEKINTNQKFKLVLLKDVYENMENNEKNEFKKYLEKLQQKFDVNTIDFGIDLLKLIDPIYKAISYSEATSCWANISGLLFGNSENGNNYTEIMMASRTKYFGRQLKRRFVIGAYISSSENFVDVFLKAKSIRTLIINRAKEILNKYDAILIPGSSSIAPLIDDVIQHKESPDLCSDALQIANFAGLPSITIPAIKWNNMPLGINITCNYKEDLKALQIAKQIEDGDLQW